MNNRIIRVDVFDESVDPAQAALRLEVVPERLTPATELRGRALGPRCRYAETVEVAYPVRPQPATLPHDTLTGRVVLPEASFWEPESPFLYQILVELWQDGRQCDHIAVAHGLRLVQLAGRGLRVNGRPLLLRGREVDHCTEAEALAMRRAGVNLWVAAPDEARAGLWELADRFGFFILGRVESAASRSIVKRLDRHASCLGWLVPEIEPFRGCHALLARATTDISGPGGPILPVERLLDEFCRADR